MSENTAPMPDFTRWPSFPFEGDMRVKKLAPLVEVEPPRSGEDGSDCVACGTPDDSYIWVSERWRVRAMDRPTGLPMVLILECRSHLDLGDLPNLLAAELGVMTVRLERAIRSLDGVARVHVNRWGDGSAHLHMWFLARPYGRLQLRGTFLSLWDDILPVIPEHQWRENLAHVAAWLADFGGKAIAEPAHIQWESPATLNMPTTSAENREDGSRPSSLDDARTGAAAADSWVRHDDDPSAGSRPGGAFSTDSSFTISDQPVSPREPGDPASGSAAGVEPPGWNSWSGSPKDHEISDGTTDAAEVAPDSVRSAATVSAGGVTVAGSAGPTPTEPAPRRAGSAGMAPSGAGPTGVNAADTGLPEASLPGSQAEASTANAATSEAGPAGVGGSGRQTGPTGIGFVGTGVLSTGAGGAAAGAGDTEP